MAKDAFTNLLLNFSFEQLKANTAVRFVKAIKETMTDAEKLAKQNLKSLVHTKTGEMESSFYSGVSTKKDGKPLGYLKNADKGAFSVEFGHGTAEPKPFIKPAINEARKKIDEKFKI